MLRKALYVILLLVMLVPAAMVRADDANEMVTKAELSIKDILKDEKYASMRSLLKDCYGIMIVPQFIKAGLIWGGAGGSGILLSHDPETNTWSAPVFYGIGAASFGFQIGVSSSELVMVVMNENGIRSLINNEVKLGADLSAAAGPVGTRSEASTTGNLVADIYSYARTRGLFAGVSLEGGVIKPLNDENTEYFGKPINVRDVLIRRSLGNDKAQQLRSTLQQASR